MAQYIQRVQQNVLFDRFQGYSVCYQNNWDREDEKDEGRGELGTEDELL